MHLIAAWAAMTVAALTALSVLGLRAQPHPGVTDTAHSGENPALRGTAALFPPGVRKDDSANWAMKSSLVLLTQIPMRLCTRSQRCEHPLDPG